MIDLNLLSIVFGFASAAELLFDTISRDFMKIIKNDTTYQSMTHEARLENNLKVKHHTITSEILLIFSFLAAILNKVLESTYISNITIISVTVAIIISIGIKLIFDQYSKFQINKLIKEDKEKNISV